MVADREWMAAQNIARFQAKLRETDDEGERRLLRDLIDREKENLGRSRNDDTRN